MFRLFRRRASADEALDVERAWRLIHIARDTGQLAEACPRCGYPDLVLVDARRYSDSAGDLGAKLASALRHPANVRAYVIACPSCLAGFAAVTMGRATP